LAAPAFGELVGKIKTPRKSLFKKTCAALMRFCPGLLADNQNFQTTK
jgi:ADP-ribosylglycohydrolase